jgi:hypothetical protein
MEGGEDDHGGKVCGWYGGGEVELTVMALPRKTQGVFAFG